MKLLFTGFSSNPLFNVAAKLALVLNVAAATANDGTTPYIEVLGIKPGVPVSDMIWGNEHQPGFENQEIVVRGYVGPVFEALYFQPIHSVSSLSLVSNSYGVHLSCYSAGSNSDYPDYERGPRLDLNPGNNSCSFEINRYGKKEVFNSESDITKVRDYMRATLGGKVRIARTAHYPATYPEYDGAIPVVQQVRSITNSAGGLPKSGVLWSIYGQDAQYFARLLANFTPEYGLSSAMFMAPQGTFSINCRRSYFRPTNNERRHDYQCEFSFHN